LTPQHTYKNTTTDSNTPVKNISICESSPASLTTISLTTKNWVSNLISLPNVNTVPIKKTRNNTSNPENLIVQNNKLRKNLIKMRRLLKQKRYIIQSLKDSKKKQQTKKIESKKIFEITKFPSVNSKTLTTMQILHKTRKPWTPREKKVALSIINYLQHINTCAETALYYLEKVLFVIG
jgi:Mg2+ and Co2+ transporter CorA